MILDTNAVSAILAGDAKIAKVLATSDHHHLTWIVLGEYEFGILGSRSRTRFRRLLSKLESESLLLFPDRATISEYSSVRQELKRKGHPIPENDVWIAAAARQHDLPVVSTDTHFDHVDRVTRISW